MSHCPSSRGSPRVFVRSLSSVALLGVTLLGLSAPPVAAGTWTRLLHNAPGPVNLMLLMPDGTVMAARNGGVSISSGWLRLTPDIHGSYVNGTWSTLANSHFTRLYYPSQVLRDGRVFVAGGEYGTGGPHAEVYDPAANAWTVVDPPASLWNTATDTFYDCNSEMTPDGRVLLMPVGPHTPATPLLYDPATNSWANAGKLAHGVYQDEASWVKLADDSVLTIDPFGKKSERYIPASNSWAADGQVPVSMYDAFGSELGAALLLPDGRAFFLGSTGHTALYTPTGTSSPGLWLAGLDMPDGKGTPDAPAAMLVTGSILCAMSPKATSGNHFPAPTTFLEYDWVSGTFSNEPAPNGESDNVATYGTAMLDLPDGGVMYSHFGNDTYVYHPDGAPLAAGKPAITSLTQNVDGSYHLVGTGLNGISEGAAYGDDLQMSSNYPLVRLTSGTSVYYARTVHWSSTSVQTGALPVTTEFSVPAGVPTGSYDLVVVANGIASDPVPFSKLGSGTWTALGAGLGGVQGVPQFDGTGTMQPGSPATFSLAHAASQSFAVLVTGLSTVNAPFKGGVMVPHPDFVSQALLTDAGGGIVSTGAWPAGVPAGFVLSFQWWIQDAAGPFGFSASNAVAATAP